MGGGSATYAIMGFAPTRSPVKGFYRSLTKSLSLGVPETAPGPTPVPEPPEYPFQTDYVFACRQFANAEVPDECGPIDCCLVPRNCPEDPGEIDPYFQGQGRYTTYLEDFCFSGFLVKEHADWTLLNPDGSVNWEFKWPCTDQYFGSGQYALVDANYANANQIFGGTASLGSFTACTLVQDPTKPEEGENTLGLRVNTATFPIAEISPTTDEVKILNFPAVFSTDPYPVVMIRGQTLSSGYYELRGQGPSGADWYLLDPYDSAQLAEEDAEGDLTLIPGRYFMKGVYSLVEEAAFGVRVYVDNPAGLLIGYTFGFWDGIHDPGLIQFIAGDFVDVDTLFFQEESGEWAAGQYIGTFDGQAPAHAAGTFTDVTDPPNVYPAVLEYSGPILSETQDPIIRLLGAGVYSGDQAQVEVSTSPQYVRLINALYVGVQTTGTWINGKTILVTGASPPNATALTVAGSAGHYDGQYLSDEFGSSPNGINIPEFFVGTDSGTITYTGIRFNVDGLPAGYIQPSVTVVISGTGIYDGTYQTGAFNFAGQQVLDGLDLRDIYFQGTVTGTYQITSPDNITGNILSAVESYPSETFSTAEPEKQGNVIEIFSEHGRVTLGEPDAITDELVWYPLPSTLYGSQLSSGAPITAVSPIWIECNIGRFLGTDSGGYQAK